MINIAIYKKNTFEIVAVVPIEISTDNDEEIIDINFLGAIIADGMEYQIYNDTEPILFRGEDGKIYLDQNKLLLNAEYLTY